MNKDWKNIKIPGLGKNYKVLILNLNLEKFAVKVQYEKIEDNFIKFKTFSKYKPGGVYKIEIYKCHIKNKNFYMLFVCELYKIANSIISIATNKILNYQIIDGYLITFSASYKFLELDNKYILKLLKLLKNPEIEYDENFIVLLKDINGAAENFNMCKINILEMLKNLINITSEGIVQNKKLELVNLKKSKELENIVNKSDNNVIIKGLNTKYYLDLLVENYKYERDILNNVKILNNKIQKNIFGALYRRIEYKVNLNELNLEKIFFNLPFQIDEEFLKNINLNSEFILRIDEKIQQFGVALIDFYGSPVSHIPFNVFLPTEYNLFLVILNISYIKKIKNTSYFIGKTKREYKDVLQEFINLIK